MTSFSALNWGFLEVLYLIITFILVLFITFVISPPIIRFLKKQGYIGRDIHKNAKPEVPESGGLIIVIGIVFGALLLIIFFPIFLNEILIFLTTILISALIGFVDDRFKLRPLIKILLTMFTGSVLFLANYFGFINITSPTVPFLGKLRLTIIYPFAAPIIVAVFTNTVNMLEGYNGEGSGTCLIACIFLLICAILWDSVEPLLFIIIGIAVLIPFFTYNKYPSKVFPGDIGTLSLGALMACIALFGSLEAAVFSALLLHVFNSFYVLISVRGFLESSSIQGKINDIILLENDKIAASTNKKAVLTIPRLLLARGLLSEPELLKYIYIITISCGFFSLMTTTLMMASVGRMTYFYSALISSLLLIPVFILLKLFPRIRGIIVLMFLLIAGGFIFLILIDIYIMPIEMEHFQIFNIQIPVNILFSLLLLTPGLIIWYVVTIKYFNFVIKHAKE
ncbi:MAG: hypothetical protein ACTSYC_04085 [Promethearchaeota archaeon]